MKRKYEKPELLCEEYELSTSIAGNCGAGFAAPNMTAKSLTSCGYKLMGNVIFLSDGICTKIPNNDGDYGMCYQVPTTTTMIFSS